MKKNLLFVIPSLSAGGGEKSLINLLTQIDYRKYNVDLLLFHQSGLFLELLPSEINIVEIPLKYKIFSEDLFKSFFYLFLRGNLKLAYARLMFMFKNRLCKSKSKAEQYSWEYQSKAWDFIQKEYDTAIGFLEKTSIYFVVDKVKARKKVGWIHTNYSNSGMDKNFDMNYFKKLDHIVTVSEECAISLRNIFKENKEKINVIFNIVSPRIINSLSTSPIVDEKLFEKEYINILTVARLSHEKGIDIAINSCKRLLSEGFKVRWFVIGEGNERRMLEKNINDNNLGGNFKLLGLKENPYPYIKNADIYVQPSRYEGKSIALDEAKILKKPIVVTNFETVNDQIINETNGLIVDMSDVGISNGIKRLIEDAKLKQDLLTNLSKEKLGTEQEINKLYKII